MSVAAELFTSVPTPGHAATLHHELKAQLLRSVRHLVVQAGKGLKLDVSAVLAKIAAVTPESRISPALHLFNYQLLRAMKAGARGPVEQHLATLAAMPESYWVAPRFHVASIFTEEWDRFPMDEAAEQLAQAGGDPLVVLPVPPETMAAQLPNISEALELIRLASPTMYDEVDEYVRNLRLFDGPALSGASDVRMFGAVFLHLPKSDVDPVLYYCEHLVHETSHLHLNALLNVDAVLLNDSAPTFTSPLRSDLRPMLGVLHATFVLARMKLVFEGLARVRPGADVNAYVARFSAELAEGLATVRTHMKPTENGQRIVDSFTRVAG